MIKDKILSIKERVDFQTAGVVSIVGLYSLVGYLLFSEPPAPVEDIASGKFEISYPKSFEPGSFPVLRVHGLRASLSDVEEFATISPTVKLNDPRDTEHAVQRVAWKKDLKPIKPQAKSFVDDDQTAVYDISAHTVYLPNGRALEAHSGRGVYMDQTKFVHLKNFGPTPPHVYKLSYRERLFHGVQALRLTPRSEREIYNRDGLLAHPYFLGKRGDSMGCVSFKNYNQFLEAYKRGEFTRLAVVKSVD